MKINWTARVDANYYRNYLRELKNFFNKDSKKLTVLQYIAVQEEIKSIKNYINYLDEL